MTKAESLRAITNKVKKQREDEMYASHKKYVDSLVNGKLYVLAKLGQSSAKVKIKSKYVPTLVVEEFVNQGFKITQGSVNGKVVLTVKW